MSDMWDVLANAMETLCFQAPIAPQEEAVPLPERPLMIWLPFQRRGADGTFGGGALTLAVEPSLADVLVADMLGLDEVSESDRVDGLGEVANVLCGRVLGHLAPEQVFDLGTPTPLQEPTPPIDSPRQRARERYLYDDGTLEVTFYTAD